MVKYASVITLHNDNPHLYKIISLECIANILPYQYNTILYYTIITIYILYIYNNIVYIFIVN